MSPCEAAGTAAEQANTLPAGLLLAIGRVESGRPDPSLGRQVPWPWTINAAGRGQWFETREEAIRATQALLDSGTRSIDVGCFQVNQLYHPAAFAGLDHAFDPAANAAYAARFLTGLYLRTGSWEGAVEAYHSADPSRGVPYRQLVFATWSSPAALRVGAAPAFARVPAVTAGMPRNLAEDAGSRAEPTGVPPTGTRMEAGVLVSTPMPRGAAPGIVAMPPSVMTVLPR